MRAILPHTENPALRGVAHDIPLPDIRSERIQTLIAQMRELLSHETHGVALAAPQVGEPLKLFIISPQALERREDSYGDTERESTAPEDHLVYINPVWGRMSRKREGKHEGCLSVRGKWGIVPRAEKATLTAYDEQGKKFTRGASGFLAHIFQHEMDHLDGVLYIDKATELYDESEQHD
jgi:peptide deformylase